MSLTKKQKAILDFIKDYALNNDGLSPTQKEIKEYFGLKSFGSVQRYLRYLEDAGYLEKSSNATRGISLVSEPASHHSLFDKKLEVPLIGQVAAGNPIEAIENPEDTLVLPGQMINPHYKHFALRVSGDSMIEDGILEDDIVIVRSQNVAKQGQTVVAVINDEATLKKFYRKETQVELHPANHRLKPIIVSQDSGEFKIVGIMVGLLRTTL